jgi:hypothetical protein
MLPQTQTFRAKLQILCHHNTKQANNNGQLLYLNGTVSYFPVHKQQQYHAVISCCNIMA